MANPYYNGGAFPATGAPATSASMRAELSSISSGFDKLPTLSGNASKLVAVNSSASALEAVSVLPPLTITDTNLVVEDNADSTRKFRFEASGITAGATRILTVPDANLTLVGTDTVQTLTNKTFNLTNNLFTATSAQLAAAVTDETGTGSLVFGTNPTISGATLTGGSLNNTPIGASTPNTGAFTTLSASSTVSGAGFSTYLASPPAIGSTAANTGAFTTLSASSSVTLSGGTANGVLYLNGSKVATSGSALTFDGTNLGVGGSLGTNAGRVALTLNATTDTILSFGRGGSLVGYILQDATGQTFYNGENTFQRWYVNTAEQMRLTSTGLGIGTSSPGEKLNVIGGDSTTSTVNFTGANGVDNATIASDYSLIFQVDANNNVGGRDFAWRYGGKGYSDGTSLMVLNSSGNLGIGTSSPGYRLEVYGTNNNNIVSKDDRTSVTPGLVFANSLQFNDYAGATAAVRAYHNAYFGSAVRALAFDVDGSERMRLDSSGNLGLGVTPSAWISSGRAIDILAFGSVAQTSSGSLASTFNAYQNSAGNWIYKTTNPAAQYQCGLAGLGQHAWYTAPSGTAGNTISFTQAMTLTSIGNLQLGGTSDKVTGVTGSGSGLTVQASGAPTIAIWDNTDASYYTNFTQINEVSYIWNIANGAMIFGTNNTERARITSGGNLLVGTQTDTGGRVTIAAGAAANAINVVVPTVDYYGAVFHNQATSGDNVFLAFGTEASFTTRGSIIYNRAGGVTAYNTTSDYRAKDIIGPVQNVGATIDALKVYEGVMKGATQSRPMLIAHEAQEHAPYAVSGVKDEVNEDGTPKFQQMDVSSLVPLLLAEIQSLRARVAALEAQP